MVNFNLGKSIGKMTEKAKKKSEEMSGKAGEQSTKIADKLEEPIAALKSSVVVTQLVEKITNEGAESAAECLKGVRHSRRVYLGVGGTCIEYFKWFVAVLDGIPPIPQLNSLGVGSLVPRSVMDKAKNLCCDLYTGFMVRSGLTGPRCLI